MDAQGVITVFRGKRTSSTMVLYVGSMIVLGGLVTLAKALAAFGKSSGELADVGAGGLTVLVGMAILLVPLRLILQTVSVFADRLEWRRFPSTHVIPYADIARVERVTRTVGIETFDEVFISMRDGTVHTVTHLADGNELVRAINTYGVRRV